MNKTTLDNQCSCFIAGEDVKPFYFENGSDVRQLENLSAPGVVLIYGRSGTGKTHLLNLIAADFNDKQPEMNVKITSPSELADEIYGSVLKGEYLNYIKEKAHTGILLLDDFDDPDIFYVRTELIKVINAIHQHGGLCIISSRYFDKWILDSFKAPTRVRLRNEGQRARCLCGCEMAERKGWNIPLDTIMEMSKKARSVTELYGHLNRYIFEHCLDSHLL